MDFQLSKKQKNFLINLEKLMNDKNVNDKCLQDNTGISASTISKWRSRSSLPSAEILLKIAKYFQVSLDDFFADDLAFNSHQTEISTENGKVIKHTVMIDSLISTPLNKFVAWKFADEYPFNAEEIKHIIPDFDLKHIEGYYYRCKNIVYYLICRFNDNSLELDRSIYHLKYNNALPPRAIPADEYIMGEIFDYFHEQNLDVASDYFFDKNSI